jgi:hypothetical protein
VVHFRVPFREGIELCHQHSAARARHPDAIALYAPVQVTTPLVLQAEGVEVVQKGHGLPILRVAVKLRERVPLLRVLRLT